MSFRSKISLRPSKRLGGFTLIELMLVLGMLVVLAALAAPSFQGMMKVRRLESSADQLRAVLRQARREAIDQGIAYRVDVYPETGKVWLRPAADPLEGESAELVTAESPVSSGPQQEMAKPLVREQSELPFGIRIVPSDRIEEWFASTSQESGSLPPSTAEASSSAPDAAEVAESVSFAQSEQWVPWFEFFPDGSARQSAVLLGDDTGRFIEAMVDEMTGAVEVSSLRHARELEEASAFEEGEQ